MKYLAFIAVTILLVGCNENPQDMNEFHHTYGSASTETVDLMNDAASKFVVFGHQSVGKNILDRMAAMENETGVSLNRQSTRDLSGLASPAFIDFSVGQNGDPQSKVDDFVSLVETIAEDQSPIAFFKFCYADVDAGTNVDEAFDYYKERMLYLKEILMRLRFWVGRSRAEFTVFQRWLS